MAVVAATRHISKAEDVRNDTKLLMAPYANWEEFLMPYPIAIALFGELVFISASTDFSVNKNPPRDGYQFIRYPESFRACLMQVVNSSWAAFNEAHKNMDQIRLHSANVGGYVKMAVKILMQDDDQLVELSLPDQLENIQTIADTCIALSTATETKFEFVINLVQELMEACVNAESACCEELEEMRRKIAEFKLRKESAEESKRRTNESLENLKKLLEEAHDQYKTAIDSMRSGGDTVGMKVVEGITNSVSSLLSSTVKVMATGGLMTPKAKSLTTSANVAVSSEPKSEPEGTLNVDASNAVYSKSCQLLQLVQQMNGFVENGKIKLDSLYVGENREHSAPAFIQEQFKRIESSVTKNEQCKPAILCLDICHKAIRICKTLASIGPEGKACDEVTTDMFSDLESLKELAVRFDTQSKFFTGAPSFPVTPPQLANSQGSTDGSKLAGQMVSDTARFRIEQSRAQFTQVQSMMQKTTEIMQQNQNELIDILVTLQNCEVKEIDFKITIEMLVKGLDVMSKVKEQWEKMVRFFQMISNIMKTSRSASLQDFTKTAKTIDKSMGYTSKNFMTDMLYQEAFYASNIANLVNVISSTYTDVSNRFLMDKISSLGRLMSMDPTQPQFQTERNKLHAGCTEASDDINLLVLKNKSDFDENVAARIAQIDNELGVTLPPASDEEIKKKKVPTATLR